MKVDLTQPRKVNGPMFGVLQEAARWTDIAAAHTFLLAKTSDLQSYAMSLEEPGIVFKDLDGNTVASIHT